MPQKKVENKEEESSEEDEEEEEEEKKKKPVKNVKKKLELDKKAVKKAAGIKIKKPGQENDTNTNNVKSNNTDLFDFGDSTNNSNTNVNNNNNNNNLLADIFGGPTTNNPPANNNNNNMGGFDFFTPSNTNTNTNTNMNMNKAENNNNDLFGFMNQPNNNNQTNQMKGVTSKIGLMNNEIDTSTGIVMKMIGRGNRDKKIIIIFGLLLCMIILGVLIYKLVNKFSS